MKLQQGPVFIVGMVNSTEDAVLQLILQDCHVTYHEIEKTLGFTGTSIHSILHEYFIVKKIFSLCQSLKKRLVPIGRKKSSKKYDRGVLKHVYNIAMNRANESWIYAYEPESKQQLSPSKWSPVFSEKLDMSQSY